MVVRWVSDACLIVEEIRGEAAVSSMVSMVARGKDMVCCRGDASLTPLWKCFAGSLRSDGVSGRRLAVGTAPASEVLVLVVGVLRGLVEEVETGLA